ncbi:hypothetical protein BGZ88_007865 [Linnemannia elongata]|nr:hypothetical protein BGZ88_007865 [Linnemannia elongata]
MALYANVATLHPWTSGTTGQDLFLCGRSHPHTLCDPGLSTLVPSHKQEQGQEKEKDDRLELSFPGTSLQELVLAGIFIGFDCQLVHVLPFLSHLTVLLMETVLNFQMQLKTAFRACPFLQEVVLRRNSSYGNPDPFLESGDDGDPEAWSGAAAVGGFAARSIAGDIKLGVTPATAATSTLLLLPMLKNLHLSVETLNPEAMNPQRLFRLCPALQSSVSTDDSGLSNWFYKTLRQRIQIAPRP